MYAVYAVYAEYAECKALMALLNVTTFACTSEGAMSESVLDILDR